MRKQWTVRSSVEEPATADSAEPPGWGAGSGRPRVLVEIPDGGDRWAHEEALRAAGYDVRSCSGPRVRGASFDPSDEFAAPIPDDTRPKHCDLVDEGRCSLVSGADLVISTTELLQGRQIIAAHHAAGTPRLVVEGPRDRLLANADIVAGAVTVEYPVTTEGLLAAVERALGGPGATG